MGGKLLSPPTDENHKAYIKNLQYAAKKFEQENIIGLIEPINKYSVPGYYLNNYEKGIFMMFQFLRHSNLIFFF